MDTAGGSSEKGLEKDLSSARSFAGAELPGVVQVGPGEICSYYEKQNVRPSDKEDHGASGF